MTFAIVLLGCLLVSFLLGAIPFGLIVGKTRGVDVRTIGSGNVGAMNVGRILGRRWFFVVFALDLLKGLLPTLVGGWLLPSFAVDTSPSLVMVARLSVALAAILGHNYSPFLGFKGGKGVSTSLGAALGVYPDLTVPALLALGTWILGFSVTRMSSVGSILGGIGFPLFYVTMVQFRGGRAADHWPFVAFTVLVALFVIIRHKANIARIMTGTETRVVRTNRR